MAGCKSSRMELARGMVPNCGSQISVIRLNGSNIDNSSWIDGDIISI